MSKSDELRVASARLADAWRRTLPETIGESDKAEVHEDEANPKSLRITINIAGHQMYSLDFKVTYIDSREIRVELIDAEKAGSTVDERTDMLQQLIEDYTRHLHECAQVLHRLTHA